MIIVSNGHHSDTGTLLLYRRTLFYGRRDTFMGRGEADDGFDRWTSPQELWTQ